MPANVYECMFLLDTNKVAGDVPAAAEQIKQLLERNHAEILASRPWDERRLAYPIKGHKKGLYYLTYFKAEGKELKNIEHDV
ncbi:MAG TPA: 30S ribosomal protein S6, partial [Gemmataceae bacterium]|nr:30S ribosomal protein S6 [Gemmataceae bacterium]